MTELEYLEDRLATLKQNIRDKVAPAGWLHSEAGAIARRIVKIREDEE